MMEIKDLMDELSGKAREIAEKAEWCDSMHAPALHEYYRYAQRCILDLIDAVRAECKTIDDVDELLDELKCCCFNEYKFYQSEHFDRFAELAMVNFKVLYSVYRHIERNK